VGGRPASSPIDWFEVCERRIFTGADYLGRSGGPHKSAHGIKRGLRLAGFDRDLRSVFSPASTGRRGGEVAGGEGTARARRWRMAGCTPARGRDAHEKAGPSGEPTRWSSFAGRPHFDARKKKGAVGGRFVPRPRGGGPPARRPPPRIFAEAGGFGTDPERTAVLAEQNRRAGMLPRAVRTPPASERAGRSTERWQRATCLLLSIPHARGYGLVGHRGRRAVRRTPQGGVLRGRRGTKRGFVRQTGWSGRLNGYRRWPRARPMSRNRRGRIGRRSTPAGNGGARVRRAVVSRARPRCLSAGRSQGRGAGPPRLLRPRCRAFVAGEGHFYERGGGSRPR